MRILIVDDSTFIRTKLRAFLTENNTEVVGEAATGESAIDMAMDMLPDLILLDNVLPDISGLDVLDHLVRTDHDFKIVMISGLAQPSAIVDAKARGAYDYLVKPIDEEELTAVLTQLAEK